MSTDTFRFIPSLSSRISLRQTLSPSRTLWRCHTVCFSRRAHWRGLNRSIDPLGYLFADSFQLCSSCSRHSFGSNETHRSFWLAFRIWCAAKSSFRLRYVPTDRISRFSRAEDATDSQLLFHLRSYKYLLIQTLILCCYPLEFLSSLDFLATLDWVSVCCSCLIIFLQQ